MKNLIDSIFEKLGKLPTTNARIAITLLIWLATAIWVLFGGVPSLEFLGTIIAMSGLDAVTFAAKRQTTHKPEELARAEHIRNGNAVDVDELIDEIEVEATTDNPELG